MKKILLYFWVTIGFMPFQTKSDPLRDLTSSFCDFTEDQFHQSISFCKQNPTQRNTENTKKIHQNVLAARKLQKDTEDYLDGHTKPNTFLLELLQARFEFLENRANSFRLAQQEFKKTGTLTSYVFLATNHDALQIFKNKATVEPTPATILNYKTVLYYIDLYQTLGKIIAELFNRHPLKDYSAQTLRYLRASVTLHPILRGESEDWSHPDFAFITYDMDPISLKYKKDFDYYDNCILKREYETTFMNWTRTRGKIFSTRSVMGCSKLELPSLSCLNPISKNEVVVPPEVSPPVLQESVISPSSLNKVMDREKKEPNPVPIENQKEEIRPEEKENSYLAPRGKRVFHPQIALFPPLEEKLSPKLQDLVDCIFDYKMFKTVDFGAFKMLWMHINGERSIKSPGSGGSHRALLNREGKVVGSTFAHGNNQTYTHKTIKYLRDALLSVGIKPSTH